MGTTLTEQQVRLALEAAKGNRQQAAADLGVNRVTLWRAMRRYEIAPAWTQAPPRTLIRRRADSSQADVLRHERSPFEGEVIKL